MAEIELQFVVPKKGEQPDEVKTIVDALNEFRNWDTNEGNGDWLSMTLAEKATQISLSRPVTDTGNHAEVQEVGEAMRRKLEAGLEEPARSKLACRFAGYAIYSANEELAVE